MNLKITNKDGITLKTAGTYCATNISIKVDDTNLVAENILEGKTILGVEGAIPIYKGNYIVNDEIPIQNGNTLTIEKVYNVVQNNDTLEVE